jgi:hypothetical protein
MAAPAGEIRGAESTIRGDRRRGCRGPGVGRAWTRGSPRSRSGGAGPGHIPLPRGNGMGSAPRRTGQRRPTVPRPPRLRPRRTQPGTRRTPRGVRRRLRAGFVGATSRGTSSWSGPRASRPFVIAPAVVLEVALTAVRTGLSPGLSPALRGVRCRVVRCRRVDQCRALLCRALRRQSARCQAVRCRTRRAVVRARPAGGSPASARRVSRCQMSPRPASLCPVSGPSPCTTRIPTALRRTASPVPGRPRRRCSIQGRLPRTVRPFRRGHRRTVPPCLGRLLAKECPGSR